MKIAVFYPDVYVRDNGLKCLIFDVSSGRFIITDSLSLKDNTHTEWYVITSDNAMITDQIIANNYAFVLECDVVPYIPSKTIHIISSINRQLQLRGYAEGFHTREFVRTIHLHYRNKSYKAQCGNVYVQVNYPRYGNDGEFTEDILNDITSAYVEHFVICGDIDDHLLQDVIPSLYGRVAITLRTYFQEENPLLRKLICDYPDINIELLVDTADSIANFLHSCDSSMMTIENYTFVPLISSPAQVAQYKDDKGLKMKFLPMVYNVCSQRELIEASLIDEEDIIAANKTMDEILMKQVFHSQYNGSICISINGVVSCGVQVIGDYYKEELYTLINRWLYNERCIWYMSRRKLSTCCDCLFVDLCPSITVYEQQHYISTACKDVLYKNQRRDE